MVRSIEDVINSLSEEEKEKFKDLIQEALERDRLIKENTEKALKALKASSKYGRFLKSLEEGATVLEKIEEDLRSIKYTMYLKSIPDSKFYRA